MRCIGFANRSDASDSVELSAQSQVRRATVVAGSMKEVAAAIDPMLAVAW
jgi:hypothetical protein